MTYNTDEIEQFALPLPITQTARQQAVQFAREQPTPHKAEQVRLNTLAVCVVNDYLQMMGIPTDLSVSDSWNPVTRLCSDVADLEVVGVGRLECRPVGMHQQTCPVPPEVWSDRIGYVVVQIDEAANQAMVLGFTQTAETEELPVSQLQPVEALIDRLEQPMQSVAAAISSVAGRTRVHLSQWLTNIFDSGWQTVESLLNPTQPDLAFSFRSADSLVVDEEPAETGIRRAKLIDFGVQFPDTSVVLVVELKPTSDERTEILLQVYPGSDRTYLPPLLELTVLDESGLVFLEAQARSADDYLQLEFNGLQGEQFSVRVALGDASFIADFAI
jgi:hypothetical protein